MRYGHIKKQIHTISILTLSKLLQKFSSNDTQVLLFFTSLGNISILSITLHDCNQIEHCLVQHI